MARGGTSAMTTIQIYRGYRLTPIEQPDGSFRVEISTPGGGKPFSTKTFRDLADAMAEARLIVDKGLLA
jgi:hypothetical protein